MPGHLGDKLLEKTMMSVDLNDLRPIGKVSERKDAMERRILETEAVSDGARLRAVVVETSTLKEKGEQAVAKQIASFRKALESFEREYSCKKDAVKAFERSRRSSSKESRMFPRSTSSALWNPVRTGIPAETERTSAVPTGGQWTSSGRSTQRRRRVCAVAKDTSCS